jgi:hypothetical protein
MDWLQFTAAITGHLAWPLVILTLLIVVRKQVHSLAERLLEFSFGGAKISFDKILVDGAQLIEKAPLPEVAKPDQQQLQLVLLSQKVAGRRFRESIILRVHD